MDDQSALRSPYIGQASLALALLAVVVVVLALLWRRFDRSGEVLWRGVRRLWDWLCHLDVVRRLHARYPRASAFVAARFTPGEYLGLHLTIGILLSVSALWLFAGITEDVLHHESLTTFDLRLAAYFHAHATAIGYTIFGSISLLGSPVAMAILASGGAIVLAVQQRRLVLFGWVAAFGGGGLLDTALKLIIRRPRPEYATAFLHGQSFSFPSGHAMGALIGYGMLAYLLVLFWAAHRGAQTAVVGATAILVLSVGLSRLYLGVHYFSDVVGGYAAGVVWLSACISGLEVARRHRTPSSRAPAPSESA